ncbi:hypothetical protein LPB142_09870 [Rhodobacter xanthinilyticus]|uniref:HTH crp-type domain-containing protein n=1 Tax=Rhodobacter xanthinilyticus TaxID=1850250 RepID=A0A1D9MCI0_9RHOB|nr:MarR family transcriptional regulator [Rhodobacter xanthinilyticus]AOZ69584.1 hypothetical protein LPB142_09870 [Rhodobacter xanthinilyticus]
MSHEATLWAVRACDVPLDERMVLVYLADCHCPDNGCLVTPERLAKEAGIDVSELHGILDRLEARGKVIRFADTDRWLLEFEPVFASLAEGARA